MLRLLDTKEPMPRWLVSRSGIAIGLLLALFALLPFSALYNVPLLVLCGLGFLRLASRPREVFSDDAFRLLLVLFLCIWLPMTVSAIDAVNPAQSWRKVASFPVFFFAGVYVVMTLRREIHLHWLLIGVFVICVSWSVDASWQFMHGSNLLGFPYRGGRVSGIFHPDLHLGIVLAIVSPFVFEAIRRLAGRSAWVVLALIPFFAAIGLPGSRSSWIVLLVVLGGYGWYLFRWAERPMVRGRDILRVAAAGVLACVVLFHAFPQAATQIYGLFLMRVIPVVDLVSGDRQTAHISLAGRFSAWESASRIFRDHWFNGVGPRGFRVIQAEYAPAYDPYVRKGQTLKHPHLLVLEIAAEAGVIGLLGYLVALGVLMRRLLDMDRAQLALGFPYGLAVLAALFPFATHMAFYAHFLGSLLWWSIAISVAGLVMATRSTRTHPSGRCGGESRRRCAGYR